jgi:hypothetical protein
MSPSPMEPPQRATMLMPVSAHRKYCANQTLNVSKLLVKSLTLILKNKKIKNASQKIFFVSEVFIKTVIFSMLLMII